MSATFTPTPFRYAFVIEPVGVGLRPLARMRGAAFKAIRIMYGLNLFELAEGWRTVPVRLVELEDGNYQFKTPADMHSALQQLWLWANEKNPGISR